MGGRHKTRHPLRDHIDLERQDGERFVHHQWNLSNSHQRVWSLLPVSFPEMIDFATENGYSLQKTVPISHGWEIGVFQSAFLLLKWV